MFYTTYNIDTHVLLVADLNEHLSHFAVSILLCPGTQLNTKVIYMQNLNNSSQIKT